jgi:hypothetical protein
VKLILRVASVVEEFGMNVKRKRWIAACALIAYSAILIKFVVFKVTYRDFLGSCGHANLELGRR